MTIVVDDQKTKNHPISTNAKKLVTNGLQKSPNVGTLTKLNFHNRITNIYILSEINIKITINKHIKIKLHKINLCGNS